MVNELPVPVTPAKLGSSETWKYCGAAIRSPCNRLVPVTKYDCTSEATPGTVENCANTPSTLMVELPPRLLAVMVTTLSAAPKLEAVIVPAKLPLATGATSFTWISRNDTVPSTGLIIIGPFTKSPPAEASRKTILLLEPVRTSGAAKLPALIEKAKTWAEPLPVTVWKSRVVGLTTMNGPLGAAVA
ncbi:hypothetical protein SAMN04488069_10149 [Hymenobacter psychrophilus]|uniref:Uncharacterized protein n=1 Tax=Hymenobacter psychrophilus TaxID=651662 RepID=A0A1H3AUN0_9BACT|nr:hypothetical protein SAMN04488069_10149 [Hymenobacter psychrophilus]